MCGLTLRVPGAFELQIGGDAVHLRLELHAPLGSLLLDAQLALFVLPANNRSLASLVARSSRFPRRKAREGHAVFEIADPTHYEG